MKYFRIVGIGLLGLMIWLSLPVFAYGDAHWTGRTTPSGEPMSGYRSSDPTGEGPPVGVPGQSPRTVRPQPRDIGPDRSFDRFNQDPTYYSRAREDTTNVNWIGYVGLLGLVGLFRFTRTARS